MYKHILVPLDSHGQSEQVLTHLHPLAFKAGSTVQLLSVYPRMQPSVGPQTGGYAHRLEEQASTDALTYLNKVALHFQKSGFITTTDVRFGDPVDMVLEAAQVGAMDLIVLPIPWFRGDGHPIATEMTTRVIQRAPMPVLVVQLQIRQKMGGF